ncbi:MAG TPA: hypothetical protein VHJ76_03740 [Actinomycetota bacterium]|nr:hypothetical protein [Actinomycetota bacterium]
MPHDLEKARNRRSVGAAAFILVNRSPDPLEVVRVVPRPGPGLRVGYIGWTDCSTGCGVWPWSPKRADAFARKRTFGDYPVAIPPADQLASEEESPSLFFSFTATRQGLRRLRAGRCLFLHEVVIEVAGGTATPAQFLGSGPVADVHALGRKPCL